VRCRRIGSQERLGSEDRSLPRGIARATAAARSRR